MDRNIIVLENIIVRTYGDDGMFSVLQRQPYPFPDQLVTMTREQAQKVRDALNRLLEPVF